MPSALLDDGDDDDVHIRAMIVFVSLCVEFVRQTAHN